MAHVDDEHGTPQTLTADNPATEIDVPAAEYPNQIIWYLFADHTNDIELVSDPSNTEGIRITPEQVEPVGPFRLETGPTFRHLAASTPTTVRVTVVIGRE